ncbi:MAG: Holliday junction resolvase RuvX [Microgenomates group bacterium]
MKILGIDYGRRKIGLAFSETPISEPLKIILYEEPEVLKEKIKRIITEKEVERVVVGVSEGEMGEESKKFGKDLEEYVGIPVVFFDETLSTQYAQELSIQAGIGRKKRHKMEDAYAASVMLQNYLDSQ